MTRRLAIRRRERGFTLVEAVTVIVITGIIAGVVAVFIKGAMDSYVDSVRRAELTDAADSALRRLVREVRLALPNSLRVTTSAAHVTYLEFIPTVAGGRYRDAGDGSAGGQFLDFTDSTHRQFDVLGPMPSPLAANDFIVVYNLGEGYEPANAYVGPTGANVAEVESISGQTITLKANPYAVQSPPLPSPNNRFHVVPAGTRAVTYICNDAAAGPGDFRRQWGYGFEDTQKTPPSGGTTALVMQNLTCSVTYLPNVSHRNGLLSVSLTVNNPEGGESIRIFHQVHVDNAP